MPAILLLIAILAAGHSEAIEFCESKLDICFVADASSSVCDGLEPCQQWNLTKQFSKTFFSRFKLGESNAKFAYVTISDDMRREFALNEHTAYSTLLPAIDKINCTGGEYSRTVPSLVFETDIFNIASGDRPLETNVLCVVTDGLPNLNDLFTLARSFAHQGAQMYPIIVCVKPGCTEEWAKRISAQPKQANETYFMVDDYCSLDAVIDIVVKKICQLKIPVVLVNPANPENL